MGAYGFSLPQIALGTHWEVDGHIVSFSHLMVVENYKYREWVIWVRILYVYHISLKAYNGSSSGQVV